MLSRRILPLASLVLLSACAEEDLPFIDDTPTISTVTLAVTPAGGSPTQFAWNGGSTVSPQLRVPVGTSTITANVRDGSGASLNGDLAGEYQLRVQPASSALQFTRSSGNPFGGTVTTAASGSTTVSICIYHVAQGQCVFGATSTQLPVTIGN